MRGLECESARADATPSLEDARRLRVCFAFLGVERADGLPMGGFALGLAPGLAFFFLGTRFGILMGPGLAFLFL